MADELLRRPAGQIERLVWSSAWSGRQCGQQSVAYAQQMACLAGRRVSAHSRFADNIQCNQWLAITTLATLRIIALMTHCAARVCERQLTILFWPAATET